MTHHPLTGVFSACVVYRLFYMNVALELRPVDIRLKIAYMTDAVKSFPDCAPGNTFTRMADVCDRGSHPYNRMWSTVHKYFDANRWYEMSDVEIADMWKTACTTGIMDGDRHIVGIDVQRVKQRWDNNGWNRYERKRNGRRSMVYKLIPVGVLATMGIPVPAV